MSRNNVMLNGDAKDFLAKYMVCMRLYKNNLGIDLYEYLIDIDGRWNVIHEKVQTTRSNGGENFFFVKLVGLESGDMGIWSEPEIQLYL